MTARVGALAAELADLALLGEVVATDADRVDHVRALEVLKSAAAATQARVTAAFGASQRSAQLQSGVPKSRAGRGIPSQIGLARRESPNKGQTLLGLATVLADEMPCTLRALAHGEINERRATLIARETATLSLENRAAVDRELCGPGGRAASLGDGGIEKTARAIGQRLDPGAAWARAKKAERERRVTIRPAPDSMAIVTAQLPVAQGVGVYAALTKHADAVFAAGQNVNADGEALNRGEVMTDEFVRRMLAPGESVSSAPTESSGPTDPAAAAAPADPDDSSAPDDLATAAEAGNACDTDDPGCSSADQQADKRADGATDQPTEPAKAQQGHRPAAQPAPETTAPPVPRPTSEPAAPPVPRPPAEPTSHPVPRPVPEPGIEIQLIMTDRTLFGLDDEPAHLTGYGPIPAPLARQLARGSTGDGGPPGTALRWIRRLYERPGDGALIAMDSRRRIFPAALRRFVVARDQFCRTPWCDALIRHADHVDPVGEGGDTCAANAQGLCEACNYAKQAPGWRQVSRGIGGDVITTTPTGHQYASAPPDLPGHHRHLRSSSQGPLEEWLAQELAA